MPFCLVCGRLIRSFIQIGTIILIRFNRWSVWSSSMSNIHLTVHSGWNNSVHSIQSIFCFFSESFEGSIDQTFRWEQFFWFDSTDLLLCSSSVNKTLKTFIELRTSSSVSLNRWLTYMSRFYMVSVMDCPRRKISSAVKIEFLVRLLDWSSVVCRDSQLWKYCGA